jgi:hypothetical protein
MDAPEPIDREIIVERAEAALEWLRGLALSSRAFGALQRELSGIIANDPGGYINGHRPLAGLTIAEIAAEVQRPNGGALGRVKSIGDGVLAELRGSLSADDAADTPPEEAAASESPPATEAPAQAEDRRPRRPRRAATPAAPAASAEAGDAPQSQGELDSPPVAAEAAEVGAAEPEGPAPADAAAQEAPPVTVEAAEPESPARRPRGRPKGSTNTTRRQPAAARAAPAPAPEAPAPTPSAPAQPAPRLEASADDQLLSQLATLWPSLHPQARRAIVFYASGLLLEGSYKG